MGDRKWTRADGVATLSRQIDSEGLSDPRACFGEGEEAGWPPRHPHAGGTEREARPDPAFAEWVRGALTAAGVETAPSDFATPPLVSQH